MFSESKITLNHASRIPYVGSAVKPLLYTVNHRLVFCSVKARQCGAGQYQR